MAQVKVEVCPSHRVLHRRVFIRTVVFTLRCASPSVVGLTPIRRTQVRAFTDKEIQLLETFASQAVIAIDNVRLFTELQASNRELTDALERQTATADILV